jgi:hypothetical protein
MGDEHLAPYQVAPAVDWLTCTWDRDNPEYGVYIGDCLHFEDYVREQGNITEVETWQGYLGRKTGSFFVGEREQGYCVRVSGSLAHLAFTSIYRIGMHASRLDVAVTAWYTPSISGIGINALSSARFAKLSGRVRNPVRITHYEDDTGGFTLYLGRRSSKAYARLYNKEIESADEYYKGAWRYEVELHNEAATSTAIQLLSPLFPIEETICSIVWTYWHSKGVLPQFDALAQGLEVVLPRREKTTIDKSLAWLETQVRPTVAKLIALGYTDAVLAALGLPEADRGHTS